MKAFSSLTVAGFRSTPAIILYNAQYGSRLLIQHYQANEASNCSNHLHRCYGYYIRCFPPNKNHHLHILVRREFHMTEQNIATTNTDKPLSGLLSNAPERAILVGADMPGTDWSVEESLDELEQLATTAGGFLVDRGTQRLGHPHPGTLLGAGKGERNATPRRV